MWKLKNANVDAAEELSRLWIQTFVEAYGDLHSEENIRAYCDEHYSVEAARACLSDCQCVLAYPENEHQPVGLCIMRSIPCPIAMDGVRASCELKQIYIRSSEYGTGLGETLLEYAMEVARSMIPQSTIELRNDQHIWLVVSDKNFRAQRFYKRRDFQPIGPGPTLVVGSETLSSTIMARNITVAA